MTIKLIKPAQKIKTPERRNNILKDCLFPHSGIAQSSLVAEILTDYGVSERTAYRDIDYLKEQGLVFCDNTGLLFSAKEKSSRYIQGEAKMSLSLATALIRTKHYATQVMSDAMFKQLTNEGIYEIAERVLLKAKQRNPNQKEFRFELAANDDNLHQLYANSAIDSDVAGTIKNALFNESELEIKLRSNPEPVYVQPQKLQILDDKQVLKVKQLNYPKNLKYIEVGEIVEAYSVDYLPFRSGNQMRRAA